MEGVLVSLNVLIPGDLRLDPLSTATSTVVLCGDMQRIEQTVPASVHGDEHVKVLPSAAALQAYADRNAPPDSCVIVTPLPDGPTVPLSRMLRARGWPRVTVLSSKADARSVFAALSSGVRAVIVNREAEAGPTGAGNSRDRLNLSDRELEVLSMVADGMTNRIIGEHLGLSALTVKSHLARIARKFGCGDRAQMVAEAIRAGYIS